MSTQSMSTRGLALIGAILLIGVLGADRQAAPAANANPQEADESKPCILFNITSGTADLHAVVMALQLAGHALDDGRDVVLFLNVRAPELARADLSADLKFADNPPLKEMLAALRERGAKMLVCPHCMKVQNVTKADLAEGVEVASRETLFSRLGPQTHVFSY